MITYKNISINDFMKISALPKLKKPKLIRQQHISQVIKNYANISGEVLEFGVWSGKTINCIADCLPDNTIYGFDSFQGLPEDWYKKDEHKNNPETNKHVKGYFAVDKLPNVRHNVHLIKGFFEDSLDPWLNENNLGKIKLLHIDCDLYSSTIYVLDKLNQHIVPGTVIIFDELYPFCGEELYPLWQEGEWQALIEWMEKFDRKIEVVSRTNGYQASVRVLE